MYVCMYVCTYVCLYVCMYVCLYVCMYVCNACYITCYWVSGVSTDWGVAAPLRIRSQEGFGVNCAQLARLLYTRSTPKIKAASGRTRTLEGCEIRPAASHQACLQNVPALFCRSIRGLGAPEFARKSPDSGRERPPRLPMRVVLLGHPGMATLQPSEKNILKLLDLKPSEDPQKRKGKYKSIRRLGCSPLY